MNQFTTKADSSREYCIDGIRYRLIDETRMLFQEIETSKYYVLQKHTSLSDEDLQTFVMQIVSEFNNNCHHAFSFNIKNMSSSNRVINGIYEGICKLKTWRDFILSDSLIRDGSALASRCPVQNDICEYKTISSVAYNETFPIRTKILILDNLTNLIMELFHSIPSHFKRIGADCIYVNSLNGNVKVFLDRCLDIDAKRHECEEDFTFLEVCDINGLTEQSIVKFLVYTSFVLICRKNPFDVTNSIIHYPLLTKESVKEINSGQMGFLYSKSYCDNPIDAESVDKVWNLLPSFFRKAVSIVLDQNLASNDYQSLDKWQIQIRMLRDSIIFVQNKTILYDWNLHENLLLLKCNDYLIPVWPRKAIYWYHVGLSYNDGDNGVIGGIDAESKLKNSSNILWSIRKGGQIGKGKSIKLEPGMNISIGSQSINVISGSNLHNRTDRSSDIISVNDDLIDDDIRYLLDDWDAKL